MKGTISLILLILLLMFGCAPEEIGKNVAKMNRAYNEELAK